MFLLKTGDGVGKSGKSESNLPLPPERELQSHITWTRGRGPCPAAAPWGSRIWNRQHHGGEQVGLTLLGGLEGAPCHSLQLPLPLLFLYFASELPSHSTGSDTGLGDQRLKG